MTARFTGFPRGGAAFFKELARRQDRAWFKANQARYQALWQQPMAELVEAVRAALEPAFPEVLSARPKVFRIQRDVRFSKDKSPYKTHIGAIVPLWPGEEMGTPGLYLQFGEEPFIAAGRWMLEPGELARFRALVDDEERGAALARQVARAERAGFGFGAHEALKRVPAPYAPDHPRAGLLKLKGLALRFPKLPAGLAAKPGLPAWVARQARAIKPVLETLQGLSG